MISAYALGVVVGAPVLAAASIGRGRPIGRRTDARPLRQRIVLGRSQPLISRPVGDKQLLSIGIDRHGDRFTISVLLKCGSCHRGERVDRDQSATERVGEHFGCCHADADAGKRARPVGHRDQVDGALLPAGCGEQFSERRSQGGGGPLGRIEFDQLWRLLAIAPGDRAGASTGFDGDQTA